MCVYYEKRKCEHVVYPTPNVKLKKPSHITTFTAVREPQSYSLLKAVEMGDLLTQKGTTDLSREHGEESEVELRRDHGDILKNVNKFIACKYIRNNFNTLED